MPIEVDYLLSEPVSSAELPESPGSGVSSPALRSKSDRIHDLLPRLLATRQDTNWSALIEAIGEEDDRLASLIEQVRLHFFVKTSSRPYLDRLAANHNLSRPRFVGMSDTDFKTYIPVLSYQPKQVKKVIDSLLDLFFLQEATTAFLSSAASEPFVLKDQWDLVLRVDDVNEERIKFYQSDFSDITSASAQEVASAYNRQAKYSYAVIFFDSVTNQTTIRIFTNTSGTQGSLEVVGGLSLIGLQLNGFMSTLGTGANTQWSISKVGDVTTFTHTGGTAPGIDRLQVGDLFLCNLSGNEGSFPITSVDVRNAKFSFTNLFGVAGSITQTAATQTKFVRPEKIAAYKNPRRALVWETQPGSISIELPATSSVVRRGLRGGFHINGSSSPVASIDDVNTITVEDASTFPSSGQFVLESGTGIVSHLTGGDGDEVVTHSNNGRLISNLVRYSYTSITDNTLNGITPDLPAAAQQHEITLTSLSKASGVVTCTGSHDFLTGDRVIIRDSSGIDVLSTTATLTNSSSILTSVASLVGVAPGQLIRGTGIPAGTKVASILSSNSVLMTQTATGAGATAIVFSENTNGAFEIVATTSTTFSFNQLGSDGTASTAGTASVERLELAGDEHTKVLITTSQPASDTQLTGPYVWDPQAPFVLSSHTARTVNAIIAGKQVKLLDITTNTIPDEEGYVIFDYGQNNQEGPVRYTYKPTENILAIDPSYVFQKSHDADCSVIALNHKGPHTLSGTGREYPPYLTNPAAARVIFQELVQSVASAGIFIDFLVRYPAQLYGTISVYD